MQKRKNSKIPGLFLRLLNCQQTTHARHGGFSSEGQNKTPASGTQATNQKQLENSGLDGECPKIAASNIQYEIADRQQAVAAGGTGLTQRMVKVLELDKLFNQNLNLFKFYLPYAESNHVFNIAYHILAGGMRLEHRVNEAAYLNTLGAKLIPDPTTAGDFCHRFSSVSIWILMEVVCFVRMKVWRQQPDSFFEEALIDADGTMVETGAQCKEGFAINYTAQWGYHPLVVSLANTGEPLYLVNRGGNRPNDEGAADWIDRAVLLCRRAGVREIRLRGDTDFTQTEHLDRWDDDNVTFMFGFDAMPNLYEKTEDLPTEVWKPPKRKAL